MRKKNQRIIETLGVLLLLFALIGFVPGVYAGTQVVKLSPDAIVALSGENVELKLIYDVLDGNKKNTGLGIRIHFNSKAIENLKIEDVYGEGMVGQQYNAKNDTENYDNDADTDKYINIAWIGILGGWPRILEIPGQLGTVVIKSKADTNISKSFIRISAQETAKGYNFEGGNAELIIH